jgi:hypothetical protein
VARSGGTADRGWQERERARQRNARGEAAVEAGAAAAERRRRERGSVRKLVDLDWSRRLGAVAIQQAATAIE